MSNCKELVVLIAEDDDGHAELIRQGLLDSGVCNRIIRFVNGHNAWEFLTDRSDKKNINPDKEYLLLLDINMPVMDGIELLELLKNDDKLRRIPVIMLTTTDEPRVIKQCYNLGCSAYITKPIEFSDFTETLVRLGLFLQIVSV